MKSLNNCVRSVAFRFGRDVVNQQAGDQTAKGSRQRNQPKAMRPYDLLKDSSFFRQCRGAVTRERGEEEVFADPQCPCEKLRGERPNAPENRRLGEEPWLALSYQDSLRVS